MLLLIRTHELGMVVMVTHRNRESLFSLVLTNHKTIKMSFDVARLVIKIKNFISTLRLWGLTRIPLRLRGHIILRKTGHRHRSTHLTKHVLEHLLQLVWIW